jgi:hypothetical protein
VADSLDTVGFNTFLDEVVAHGISPRLGEALVIVRVFIPNICVAMDAKAYFGISFEKLHYAVQSGMRTGVKFRAVRLKVNPGFA